MFRIDPERVPASGIKARCARCSNVFELTREGVKATAPAPGPKLVQTPPAPERPAPERLVPRPLPASPPPVTAHVAAASVATATAATAADPVASAPSTKRPSFRNQDPAARAQRLARALVSDIVAYNKERLQQATGAAALRSEFRDEIRKSWEEYVEQVGLDTAKGTPYFRDALNEILAKGAKIF
jgi:predicted lipid-binding transport protein (Tim44 family)